jgi:hypothetical protein
MCALASECAPKQKILYRQQTLSIPENRLPHKAVRKGCSRSVSDFPPLAPNKRQRLHPPKGLPQSICKDRPIFLTNPLHECIGQALAEKRCRSERNLIEANPVPVDSTFCGCERLQPLAEFLPEFSVKDESNQTGLTCCRICARKVGGK